MDFITGVYPGFALACTLVLLALSLGQAWMYKNEGHKRARDLAIFCFSACIFASNVVVTHSRMFSPEFSWFMALGLQPFLFIAFYFYMKSLSYFVVIPKWTQRLYYNSQIILFLISLTCVTLYYTTGVDYLFARTGPLETGNFFVDSYTIPFGPPTMLMSLYLAYSSLITIIATVVIFSRVYKGSRDIFILSGLAITMLTLVMDHLLLPITIQYYIPFLFFSNMLEALRMCFLSTEESNAIAADPKLRAAVEKADDSYQNKTLSDERIQDLTLRLNKLMEEDRVFENPNLKLENLAYEMGIPSYLLSQVLRFGLNKNFYEMVNSYRIKEVQKMLQDPSFDHATILDLAYQAGFNSKSSFNAAFKKVTGQTPSQYRRDPQTSDSN